VILFINFYKISINSIKNKMTIKSGHISFKTVLHLV
jgi:hypothetical protein